MDAPGLYHAGGGFVLITLISPKLMFLPLEILARV